MVVGSNPSAATLNTKRTAFTTKLDIIRKKDQRTQSTPQTCLDTKIDQGTPLKQAVSGFLLSCKVESKANGTIDCYSDKLKGFLWYSEHYGLPTDVTAITTQNIREFLAYLRDNEHRWGSDCHRANKPVNSTTIQKYYRILCNFWNWMIREELAESNPLSKIKAPKAERKVITIPY